MRILQLLCFIQILLSGPLEAQVYVATTGSDATGNGTPGNPYATIVKGVQSAPAGGSVLVAPGVYNEVSEVFIGKALTLAKNGTGQVVIDAVGRSAAISFKYMIGIVSTSNVVVDGINLRNCIGFGCKGFYVLGSGSNITIRNCAISNIGWVSNNLSVLPPNPGDGANPLLVLGNSSTTAFTNIQLLNNTVSNCATGWSEAITISGNVDGFLVENNVVYDIANIGIDAAGNYDTILPPALRQARNGTIRSNEVYRCMSGIATASGIYLDGALNCIIERNRVYQCGTGISVGGEQALSPGGTISGHRIRNNLVHHNVVAGIFLGTNNAGNAIQNTTVYNNTFYRNRTGELINGISTIDGIPLATASNDDGGDILLQNISSATLQNNIVQPLPGKKAMVALFGYTVSNFASNYNLYYRTDAAPFFSLTGISFNGAAITGTYFTVADFTAATGLEANSTTGQPGFVRESIGDFSLATGALAIDKGNPVYNAASGSTDITGNPRVYNNIRTDAGAYEYQGGAAPPAITYTFTGSGQWNVPGNWSSNTMPPAILPVGSQIVINPIAAGQAVLNRWQVVANGASLQVTAGKKLLLPGKLSVAQ